MPSELEQLRTLEERISLADERIANQKQVVARLEERGENADGARETLAVLENDQQLLLAMRRLLLRRLEP